MILGMGGGGQQTGEGVWQDISEGVALRGTSRRRVHVAAPGNFPRGVRLVGVGSISHAIRD